MKAGDEITVRLPGSRAPRLVKVVALSAGVVTLSGPTLPQNLELHESQVERIAPPVRRKERIKGGSLGNTWRKVGR